MKKIVLISLIQIYCSSLSFGQFQKGDIELALMGTAGVSRTDYTSFPDPPEASSYALINTCVGYYLVDGLSVESQLGFLVVERELPSQSVLLGLSYTKRLKASNVALFVRASYGFSNSISSPMLAYVPIRISDKWDVRIMNVGTGVKFLLGENVAFRCEVGYRRDSFPTEEIWYSYEGSLRQTHSTTQYHSILTYGMQYGISVVL